MNICSTTGCDRAVVARALCSSHYAKTYKLGLFPARPTAEERFWAKVDKDPPGCWLWVGARTSLGYGQFHMDGAKRYAHRVAYEFVHGPIDAGLVLDHLCRTPSCVNPQHLEPVTQRVNVLRGESPMAKQARQTTCAEGHPLSVGPSGKRRCLDCRRAWSKARSRRQAAKRRRIKEAS